MNQVGSLDKRMLRMNHPMLKIIAFASLVYPATVAAQSIVDIPQQQCVWHEGDDPRWAAQTLDESGWQPWPQWKPDFAHSRFWVRCHFGTASLRGDTQPAIQVVLFSAYQLYLNGVQIGAEGNFSNGNSSLDAIRLYPAQRSLLTAESATIALRIRYRITLSNSGPFRGLIDMPLQLRAGDAPFLDALRARTVLTRAARFSPTAIGFGIIGVLAVVLLGLFFYDRSRSEFLLLSISCLSLAALRVNEFASASMLDYSVSAGMLIICLCNIGLTVTQVPFFYKLARRPMPKWITVLLVAVAAAYIPTWMDAISAANQPVWMGPFNAIFVRPFALLAHTATSLIPFFAFWPYAAIQRRMRPVAILCMMWGAADLVWFMVELTAIPIPGVPNFFARWGLALLAARAFTTACVLAALLALLFRDQRQVTEERAHFAGEVQAARSVQQYLIPTQMPATPGFSITSEYRPAREVGGDFFQVLPDSTDDSLLIIVGDVAGKGIEAGMLATLIVGAVRTAASFTSDPARILALLNERLCGRGLVTCLALRIEQDGGATLVNAGHLPPYLNGKELLVEGALPLGAVPGLQFPALRFTLEAGDSLMLMTDGAVEAQGSNGRLFGFERIGEMLQAGTDGAGLAAAAQEFGQEDDITVLTVTRLGSRRSPADNAAGRVLATS
jgi:hypothetical protein